MPRQELVEVFSDAVNRWILRTPGRNFPGVVIQGDTLRNLYRNAERVQALAQNHSDEDLLGEVDDLCSTLKEMLMHYEQVLKAHAMELPYCGRISD
jgi:uncharacterized protein DUF6959